MQQIEPGPQPTARDRDAVICQQFAEQQAWGLWVGMELYHCHPGKIRDATCIAAFVRDLCQVIDMRRFGEPTIVRFGEDEAVCGYSLLQLIETSTITAHFIEVSDSISLDIYICKAYGPHTAAAFCQHFFEAGAMDLRYHFRGRRHATTAAHRATSTRREEP